MKTLTAHTREEAAAIAGQAARAEWDNTAPGGVSYIDIGGKRIVLERPLVEDRPSPQDVALLVALLVIGVVLPCALLFWGAAR